MNRAFLLDYAPPWEVVRDHPPVKPRGIFLARLERIGSTSGGGDDMVLVPLGDDLPEVVELEDASGRRMTIHPQKWVGGFGPPGPGLEQGHARVEERDGRAVTMVRTPTGDYRATFLMPRDCDENAWIENHAFLYQRQRVIRDSALPVPVEAGALQRVLAGGREHAVRARTLGGRVRAKVDTEYHAQRGKREIVTVALVVPKVRGMQLRIRAEHPVFPELAGADRRELPALVGEAMARAMPPRAYQAVLAGMSLVFKESGARLDDDGELPDKFRLEVMRVMGMPSRAANAAQRQLVRDAMQFLVHAEVLVKPVGDKRAEYLPILVRESYVDDPGVTERRPGMLMLNRHLLPAMDSGHRWLVPEALFQVSDDADRDGVTRLLGFQLAHRLGMGTSGHERLELMLRRAGLWEWAQKQARVQRGTYVMDTLRRSLDELRALPHAGHAPADIVGGTVIVGTELSEGRVEYRDAPPWTRSSG